MRFIKGNEEMISSEKIQYPARNGFTLLELMVVVFILGLMASIVVPRLIGRLDKSKIEDAKLQIRNFETALMLFKRDNGFYPDTSQGLGALVEQPKAGRIPENYRNGGYLKKSTLPKDPWGHAYVYASPGMHGDFDIISMGADGEEGGEDYDADIHNWQIR